MNKIFIKDIAKKYNNFEIKTEVIENFKYVQEQRRVIFNSKNKEELLKQNLLWKSRISEFKKIWGKQDFIYKGEFNMYAWVIEHEGCEAIIFSGNGKGTVVEIILDDNFNPKGSIEKFYDKWYDFMTNI